MNLAEAIKRVQSIRNSAGDDERAHRMEDALYTDFIKHVSETGNKALREIADEILKTGEINFARWCA